MAKVLSIEIGVATIRIVEMDYQAKKPKVYKCADVTTPEGAIKDGYLDPTKMEPLRAAISETIRKNKMRAKRVIFTVFSGKIISREITTPVVKEHQIGAFIESNSNEYFPIELDEYKLAHSVIQSYYDGDNAGRHKVLVMAAERELFVPYERLAAALRLQIMDIDYVGNSVIQAAKQSAGAAAIMAVKAEPEYAIITILHQGTMMIQRTVNYSIGLGSSGEASEEDNFMMLTGTVTRMMDFYASNDDDNKVQQVFLMGEGSRSDTLLNMLERQTGAQCRLLDNVRSAAATKSMADAHVNLFAAAIGAGVQSVGFDAEKVKERHETNYLSACFLMILLFGVAAGGLCYASITPYNTALAEQRSLQTRQQQLEPARVVHDQYLGLKDFIDQVRYGNRLTEHFNDGIIDFLEELEMNLPEDVELTDFSSDDAECVMTIRVGDKETAAGIIQMLREFESLEDVKVESLIEEVTEETLEDIIVETVQGNEVKTINFTVTCTYKVEALQAPVPALQPPAPEGADAAAETTE